MKVTNRWVLFARANPAIQSGHHQDTCQGRQAGLNLPLLPLAVDAAPVIANLLAQFAALVGAHLPRARLFGRPALLPALDLFAPKIFARRSSLLVPAPCRPALVWRPAGLRPSQLGDRECDTANKNEKAFHWTRVANRRGVIQAQARIHVHAGHVSYNGSRILRLTNNTVMATAMW